tara:strand:- start:143 stop:397 length:255 start_codon:yes stop_codon:yes gene_type:complete
MPELHEQLVAARQAAGLGPYQLARISQVSYHAIRSAESGGNVSIKTLRRLAVALGVRVQVQLVPTSEVTADSDQKGIPCPAGRT